VAWRQDRFEARQQAEPAEKRKRRYRLYMRAAT
jgi:hypothetical protein